MARTFLLSALVTRARQRADMEGSTFVSDTEVKGLISTIYAELAALLNESGLRYFESEQSLTTTDSGSPSTSSAVSGVGLVATDYLGTVGVDYVDSSGNRYELAEAMAQERNAFQLSNGSGRATHYAIIGGDVRLYPTPPNGQTYKHVYVPQPTDLSAAADATSVDVVLPAGESLIISGVARLLLAKEESDASGANQEYLQARQALQEWAQLKSINSMRRRIVDEPDAYYDPTDWRWR